jgi:hypothetical protein
VGARPALTPGALKELVRLDWWLRGLVLLLLGGYLLFSHGCHGDEDTELFCPLSVVGGPPVGVSPSGGLER